MDKQEQAGSSSELYTEKYFLSFPDGSLTRKFLKFSDYLDNEKRDKDTLFSHISEKVYQLSGENKPHYYIGTMKPDDFNTYLKSKTGEKELNLIKTELAICFTQLAAWARVQNLEIIDENQQIVTVDEVLNQFQDRLLNGELSDRSVLFYADGKKAIETISLLIQDETIDLDFRRNQLISLSTDGNLRRCADGCYSRFITVADFLKSYAEFSLPSLIKKFVVEQARKQTNQPGPEGRHYIKLLCNSLGISILDNEIHAHNYLINRVLTDFGLGSLTIKDGFAQMFYHAPYEIYERYSLDLKKNIRASHFIKFLQKEFYQREKIHFSEIGISSEIDIKNLDSFLLMVGTEENFNLHEIVEYDEDTDKSILKNKLGLSITLSERLLNSEWFSLGMNSRWNDIYKTLYSPYTKQLIYYPIPQESQNYRIFHGNLWLTWLKLDGERKTFLNIIEKYSNPVAIFEKNFPDNQLGALLTNIDDVILFFSSLPTAQHAQALDWLSKSQFKFHMAMLNKIILAREVLHLDAQASFEKYDLMINLNKFFYILEKKSLNNLLNRFELNIVINELLTLMASSSKFFNKYYLINLAKFIRFILTGGFREFKNLCFNDRNNFIYLEKINFYDTTLENVKFETSLKEIKFSHVAFGETSFHKSLENIYFENSDGKISFFSECSNIYLINFQGDLIFNTLKIMKHIELKYFIGNFQLTGIMQNFLLDTAKGKKILIDGYILNSEFSRINFKKIEINGKIKNSYFAHNDFRNTRFVNLIDDSTIILESESIFTGKFYFSDESLNEQKDFLYNSKFSTQSLIELLNYPTLHDKELGASFYLLRGTDLREIDFNNMELQHSCKQFTLIDLTRANLEKTDLENFITNLHGEGYRIQLVEANLKFANLGHANLAYVDLTGAVLRDCDLSTVSLQFAVLKQTQIDRSQIQTKQLFTFYNQDHRDFSSVRLVGDLDPHFQQQSLTGAKLSLQAFEHLIQQGFRNFKETDLKAIPAELVNQYQQLPDFNFENVRWKKESTLNHCLETHLRRKREQHCLFDWQDVNQFNEKYDERNLDKLRIDSGRFLEAVGEMPAIKRAQMIDFISHYPIVGPKIKEVQKLTRIQAWQAYLNKVYRVVNLLNSGLMGKDTLIDFLQGDYEDTAINLGLMSSTPVLSHFAQEVLLKGEALQLSGKQLLGNAFKMASPFLGQATSAYIVYDLVQAIKELDQEDASSVLRTINDGIFIGMDVAEIGIETVEIFGILEGVSSILGPIGAVINTVVFLGTDIYQAVNRVQQINVIIPLTATEKFYEGLRAFFGINVESHLQHLIDEKQINNYLSIQALNYLKQHSSIQHYIFPTIQRVKNCSSEVIFLLDPFGFDRYIKHQRCKSDFNIDLDNQIILDQTKAIKWSRAKPDIPIGAKLLCFRSDENGELNVNTYLCQDAMGISLLANDSSKNYTLINVGEGRDEVQGFLESPNIIVASKGLKTLYGGYKDDIFILRNAEITGTLNGLDGMDTLELREFAPQIHVIFIDLANDNFLQTSFLISIHSIEQVLGRPNKQDKIICACDTVYIEARGGQSNIKKDEITIPFLLCDYHITFKLAAYTLLRNQAERGSFTYLIAPQHRELDFYLERAGTHRLFFDYHINELTQLLFNSESSQLIQRAIFHFKSVIDKQSSPKADFTIVQWSNKALLSFHLKDQTEIKLGKNRVYILQKTQQPLDKILQDYPEISERLRAILVVKSHGQQIVIGSSQQEVLQNDPYYPSHLVGNGKENIYQIIAGEENSSPQDVTLYQLQPHISTMDSLDLRPAVKALEQRSGCPISYTVYDQDKDLCLYIDPVIGCSNQTISFKVILKDTIPTAWYEQLHIITHHSFLEIKLLSNKTFNVLWGLKPKPLIWDETKRIMVIHAHDIEFGTPILIPDNLKYLYATRMGEQLTDLSLVTHPDEPFYAIILKDYYSKTGPDRQKFSSLLIHCNHWQETVEEIIKQSYYFSLSLTDFQTKTAQVILPGNGSESDLLELTKNYDLLNEYKQPISLDELQYKFQEEIYRSIKLSVKAKRSLNASFVPASNAACQTTFFLTDLSKLLYGMISQSILMLQTNIENFSVYLSNTYFSNCSDSLNQISQLRNKTAITHPNPIQENTIKPDLRLESCASLQFIDIDQEYNEGVTCKIPTGQIYFFHNLPYKTPPTPFKQREASFANCRSVEWYGRSAVTCEGEKVTAIITPDLPERIFDRVDNWLMLGQVAMAVAKNIFTQFFPKPVTDTRYQCVNKFAGQTALLLEIQLKAIDWQLQKAQQKKRDPQQLKWIYYRLEDRQEEFEQFMISDRITDHEKSEFQESLLALQEMLDEVAENSSQVPSKPQQDKDIFARAANNRNYGGNAFPSFFSSTQESTISSSLMRVSGLKITTDNKNYRMLFLGFE